MHRAGARDKHDRMFRGDGGGSVRARDVAWGLLLGAALGVRLYRIAEPPFDFHPTRQFHAAVIARALDLVSRPETPARQRAVAETNIERASILEPPLLELLSITSHRLLGGDYLLAPRLVSVFAWVAGAAPVAAITRRFVGSCAVLAAAIYLLLPFGVLASRSFQPDPLMVSASLFALWAIVRHDESPGPRRLAWAVTTAAAATFLKPPVAFFFLGGAFLSLSVARHGLRRGLARKDVAVFFALAPLPAVLYTAWEVLVTGALRGQSRTLLQLFRLQEATFWNGWLEMLDQVLGVPLLAAVLCGVLLADGRLRALLLGLWAGDLAFGLAFTYHIYTHNYYHLPALPIAVLSLCPLLARVGRRAMARGGLALLLAAAPLVWRSARTLGEAPDPAPRMAALGALRDLLGPTNRVVSLSGDYGMSLAYVGDISSISWPSRGDLDHDRATGVPVPPARERLERLIQQGAELFVVLDAEALATQPDLAALLGALPVRAAGDGFTVHELGGARVP